MKDARIKVKDFLMWINKTENIGSSEEEICQITEGLINNATAPRGLLYEATTTIPDQLKKTTYETTETTTNQQAENKDCWT